MSLKQTEARYQRASAHAEAAREERNAAIMQAIADGKSHAWIAEQTGLTRARVGQIALAGRPTTTVR
jgi:DNA-binding NarL/FixJ family response regulator